MTEEEYQEIKTELDNREFREFDCIRFIRAACQQGKTNDAVKYGNLMMEYGNRYIAEVLANTLHGEGCPINNDDLWMRLMNAASLKNEIVKMECEDIELYVNECGLWVTGHQLKDDYVEHMRLHHAFEIDPDDIQHVFLKREGNILRLTSEDSRETLPITTCLNLSFEQIAA